MHLVSLQQAAGVEAHFSEFVIRASQRHPDWTQGWINPERSMHPFLRTRLENTLARSVEAKYRWGIKLPSRPASIRVWHCRRSLVKAGTGLAMIWNRTARHGFVVAAMRPENCIHWEHGGAWHAGRERERSDYLHSIQLAIANSKASARVLRLLWNFPGRIEVCLNALRPSLLPDAVIHKRYPNDVLKLGVAARLMPVKGIPQVLHAVKALVDRGRAVELQVAGAGPERAQLEALAERLGLSRICRFLGSVESMSSFYRSIDCLVHVPLTEAFGLVAIEAAAHGCPTIVAAVDGLPEAVRHGTSGVCLEPSLPVSAYAESGGGTYGIPAYVYDPRQDGLSSPKLVDPSLLADAIEQMFANAGCYETMSRAAASYVREVYDFDRHVDQVMCLVRAFKAKC